MFYGLNPKTETRGKDAPCSEGSQNGQDGKGASTPRGVPAPGGRTNEDLRKHWGSALELRLQRKLLYTWKYQFEGRPEPRHANRGATAEDRDEKRLRDQIVKLKSALGEKALENDFQQVDGGTDGLSGRSEPGR